MTEHSISKIDILGENQFGNVYFSVNIQNTGWKWAIKYIKT